MDERTPFTRRWIEATARRGLARVWEDLACGN
jgi:hypothetical protein